MPIAKLTDDERDAALAGLPEWRHVPERDGIVRTVRFPDFPQAFAFMTRVALLAEAQDHHPEWSNSYGRVDILLTTHASGGLSRRDLRMAAAIDALLA